MRANPSPALGIVCLLLAAASAPASPRYALRAGQSCNLCHHDPSGGGLRSTYASQYLIPERIARAAPETSIPVTLPDPQIGQDVVIGADLRTTHLYRENTSAGNNFLQMQGAVSLSFQPHPRFSGVIQAELGQGDAQAHAIYALAYVLPASGYVRAGRFVPPFGWKAPDHRAFVRRDFVFLPPFPPHADTGVEVGFRPASLEVQLAVLNGAPRSARDPDDELALSVRAAWSRSLGGLHAVLGGSYYSSSGPADDVSAGGPFAGAHWGRVTWHGEADWSRRERPEAIVTSLTTSHEIAVELAQGIDAVATYDFHDVDWNRETGAVHRLGGGLEFFPYPFLQLKGKVNAFRLDEGPDVSARTGYVEDFVQSILELHFLY